MAASRAPTRVSEGQTCHALQRTRSLTLHALTRTSIGLPSAAEPVTPEPPPRLEGHRAICTHHKRDDGTCRGIEAHPRSLPGLIQREHEPPARGKSLEPELPGAVRCRGRHRPRGVLQNRPPAGDRLAIDADGSVREGGPVAFLARMADHHAGEHTGGRARGRDSRGARAKEHDRHEEQHGLPHDPSTLGAHTRVPGGRRVSRGARFLHPESATRPTSRPTSAAVVDLTWRLWRTDAGERVIVP